MESTYNGIKFTDTDILDYGDFIPSGEYNPHKVHPFLLHDHGFTICVVFAPNLQDALDIAADDGKLDRYQVVDEHDLADDAYMERVAYLGNASEPFDIESLSVEELPNPTFSFCALFNNK